MKINTSKKMIYIISASVAAVILIGLIVYFCLSTGKDNPDGEPNPTAGVSSDAEETEITATETKPTPEETEVTSEPVETEPTEPEPTEPEPTEPPHIHSYKAEWTKGVTCTENGYTHYVCSCGHSYNDGFIYAIGQHSWGEWLTTKPATVYEEGQKVKTCSVCGTTIKETIPRKEESQTANISAGIKIEPFNGVFATYISEDDLFILFDYRRWGNDNLSIIKNGDGSLHVEYYNKDNQKVEFELPYKGEGLWSARIFDDGTYKTEHHYLILY